MGRVSFWHPPDWYIKKCDVNPPYGDPYIIATFAEWDVPCNGEEGRARVWVRWYPGPRPLPSFDSAFVETTSSASAKAAGVNGTRETFRWLTDDAGSTIPKGTILVFYSFPTPDRTYELSFYQFPNETNRIGEFDKVITETLGFE